MTQENDITKCVFKNQNTRRAKTDILLKNKEFRKLGFILSRTVVDLVSTIDSNSLMRDIR